MTTNLICEPFKILIGEDDRVQAGVFEKRLRQIVKSHPLEVFIFDKLADVIEQSHILKCNLTFLDPNLADTNDWREAVRAVKLIHPPVSIVTGMEKNEELEREALACGVVKVYYKPADIPKIEEMVLQGCAEIKRRIAAAQ